MSIPRQIFEVDARIVDAAGAFTHLTGYPKAFDSRHYGNDIDKTLLRAKGDAASAFSAMCLQDTRQLQVVTVVSADGQEQYKEIIGAIADLPDPS